MGAGRGGRDEGRGGVDGGWTLVRHLAIRSGVIPPEELARLTSEQIRIFLQVENPEHWPPGLRRLARYADLHKKDA
jgi:hypothetical protein